MLADLVGRRKTNTNISQNSRLATNRVVPEQRHHYGITIAGEDRLVRLRGTEDSPSLSGEQWRFQDFLGGGGDEMNS